MSALENCRVNDVVGVTYGSTPEERILRVVAVRDTNAKPVTHKTVRSNPYIPRGRYLITCKGVDGQIRSFYAGKERSARKLNPLYAAILYVRGKLPARQVV